MPALDAWTPEGFVPSPWQEACRERDELRALLLEANDELRRMTNYRDDYPALCYRIDAALEKP
jgi:hypothetical protein